MRDAPAVPADTKYARSGDVSIAYQVIGDGPVDLVLVPGIVSHVEFFHEIPGYTAYLERLTRFARVITFDKRGNGLSDRPERVGTLEERMDDMRAVMDAVGSTRAAVVGWSEGGPMAILFAATYPERVSHLVLSGTFACYVGDAMHGEVAVPELFDTFVETIVGQWGQGAFCKLVARGTLDRFQGAVRREIARHRGLEVNTRGDDFLIRFDGPARAIRCARSITEAARPLDIQVRSGIHTGEVELRGADVAGLTVHIGARVASLAEPGEVLATTTVRDLVVGSGLRFEDRGEHDLKGVPGRWRLVSVRG